jgi:hypothetical protein
VSRIDFKRKVWRIVWQWDPDSLHATNQNVAARRIPTVQETSLGEASSSTDVYDTETEAWECVEKAAEYRVEVAQLRLAEVREAKAATMLGVPGVK